MKSFNEGLTSLARLLLPEIRKFFESEEGQKLFEEYEASLETRGDSDAE